MAFNEYTENEDVTRDYYMSLASFKKRIAIERKTAQIIIGSKQEKIPANEIADMLGINESEVKRITRKHLDYLNEIYSTLRYVL